MSDVIYYIAMALFVLSGIAYGVYISNLIKNKLRVKLENLLKKDILILGGASFGIILSLVLFTVAFYKNPVNLDYFTKNSLIIDAGHQFLSYFFVILFGASMMVFLTSALFFFFFDNFDSKFRKITKILMWSMVPVMAFTFIIMSEGNAPYLQYPLCNSIYIGKHGIKFINSYTKPEPYFIVNSSGHKVLDGGISIAFYAIFILSGALFVFGLCDHRIYQYYGKHGLITTCFFIAFPMGIVGARLWYVLLDISDNGGNSIYIKDPIHILMLNEGGLGIMGGAILGIISGVAVMLVIKYWKKDPDYAYMSYLRVVDLIVPTILIAQAVGRIGNFFNCEVHGNEIPLDSLCWLPTFIKMNYQFDNSHFIGNATQAYLPLSTIESITNLVGYFVIYYGIYVGLGKYHANGSCVGWYLVWYGLTRLFLEPLRYHSYEYDMSIRTSYWMIGIGLVIVLFFAIWKILRDKKLLWYKTREYVDGTLIKDTEDNKIILRNSIILGVVIIAIIVISAICLNL